MCKLNRNGFTLIELLAVVCIIGILMLLAIPATTKIIDTSKKDILVKTMDSYIESLRLDVVDSQYNFEDSSTVFAVPIECIELEHEAKNPYGEWLQANDKYWAYVLVQYDAKNQRYIYGFTYKDSVGYGLYPVMSDYLNKSGSKIGYNLDLEKPVTGSYSNLTAKENWSGFNINDDTKLVVFRAESEGEVGNNIDTCTLVQKGKNYIEVEGLAHKPIKLNKNGIASLVVDRVLENSPMYYNPTNKMNATINGNGHIVTQNITSTDCLNWTDGRYPNMAYIFTSTNGSKVVVNDLTIAGQAQSVMLGHYVNATYNKFDTELNNVNIVDLKVFSFSSGVAPGVAVYGKARINNCNIYGTKMSSLDTEGYTVYDMVVVNYTNTIINNSKIGSIYTWSHAYLELNDSEVDTIETRITKTRGNLVIGSGTHVGSIVASYGTKLAITIKAGAVVDTLDLTKVTDLDSCVITIEDGATVGNIIYP